MIPTLKLNFHNPLLAWFSFAYCDFYTLIPSLILIDWFVSLSLSHTHTHIDFSCHTDGLCWVSSWFNRRLEAGQVDDAMATFCRTKLRRFRADLFAVEHVNFLLASKIWQSRHFSFLHAPFKSPSCFTCGMSTQQAQLKSVSHEVVLKIFSTK